MRFHWNFFLKIFFCRFINARRRIVQPMIDQNNRAGRSGQMNVCKNRRRNRSEQSPGPSPDSGSDSGANYSPDPSSLAASTAMPYPAEFYMQRTMPYGGFPSFTNPWVFNFSKIVLKIVRIAYTKLLKFFNRALKFWDFLSVAVAYFSNNFENVLKFFRIKL